MKTILVIGGCGGIGGRIVEELLSDYQIIVADCNVSNVMNHPNIRYLQVDITKEDNIYLLKEQIEKVSLTGIIFSAGVMLPGSIFELDYEKYLYTMDVNINSVYRVCQLLLPCLLKESKSYIIALASHLGVVGSYNLSAYSISKAALIELVKCLALDYGDKGLVANCISPAFVKTEMLNNAMEQFATNKKWMFATGGLPKQRMNVDDIAKVARLLLEQESINGSNIVIDGAYTAR